MSRGWLLLFGLIGASLIPLVLGGSDMFSRLRAFPAGQPAADVRHDRGLLVHQRPAPAAAARRARRQARAVAERRHHHGQRIRFLRHSGRQRRAVDPDGAAGRRGLRPAQNQRGVRGRPVGRPDVLPLRPRCDPDLCPQPFAEPEHGIEPDLQRGIPGRPVRRRGNADPLPAPGDPLQRAGSSAARRVIAQAPALGPQDPAFPHCPARQPAPAETTPAGGLPSQQYALAAALQRARPDPARPGSGHPVGLDLP